VRCFANSLDCYRGRDELADPGQAQALILRLDGRDQAMAADMELSTLRHGRAALRAALGCSALWNLSSSRGPAQQGAGSYAVSLSLSASAQGMDAHPGPDGAETFLAPLFLELLIASRTGQAHRLKACANTDCQWLFWDSSRPGSARWCSMRVCGGQAKTRRYRERQAQRD